MTTSTFILVPGAGGDAFYWHRVVPLLRDAGHEAVAVRLPAGEDGAGLAAYADTIAAAMGDHRDVVLVAQSMGAFSAPIAAAAGRPRRADRARRPDDPRARRDRPASSGRRAARTPPSAPSPSRRAATPTRRSTCTRCSSTTCPPTSPSACSRTARARDEGKPFVRPVAARRLARRPDHRDRGRPRPAVPAEYMRGARPRPARPRRRRRDRRRATSPRSAARRSSRGRSLTG